MSFIQYSMYFQSIFGTWNRVFGPHYYRSIGVSGDQVARGSEGMWRHTPWDG